MSDVLDADGADLAAFWLHVRDLALVTDPDGTARQVSPSAARILGRDARAVAGHPVAELALEDDRHLIESALRDAMRTGAASVTLRCRHGEGGSRWMAFEIASSGDRLHLSGRDVSGEREAAEQVQRAQAALRQVQKMEAIGQLTAGIAHGFNNMLAAVVGSLDLLGRRIAADDARARRHVDNAMEGARRAATLTQRLLAFSRQQTLAPAARDVNALVAEMVEILRHTLSSRIRLDMRTEPELWPCFVDGAQLEAAILNLAVNARDAMPEGGRVVIETRNGDRDVLRSLGETELGADAYVVVSVRDEGTGMTPEVAAKAFDPFFTTKEIGRGTGLGLSQVYGFVRQSGGHVRIATGPGRGTAVKLYLPRAGDRGADEGTTG